METPLRTNTEILIQPLLRLPMTSGRLYKSYKDTSRDILLGECMLICCNQEKGTTVYFAAIS